MKPSHPIGRSTSGGKRCTRHLNAFRGVRAISEFDWPFTPTHTSSRSFSTLRRSLGFASATADYAPSSGSLSLRIRRSCGLASPATATRRFIMQKARRHSTRKLRPLVGAWFQVLFHSPHRGAFHRSLTVLYAIGLTGVFSLAGWSRPALLRIPLGLVSLHVRGYHPL